MKAIHNLFVLLAVILFSATFVSCSDKEDEPRQPEDLVGIWTPSDTKYLEFLADYNVHNLDIEYQDGETIGIWNNDAYIYEPGYHIVIFLAGTKADVYQIIDLSEDYMTWCWVKEIIVDQNANKETIGKILGEIIKEAQEGFKIDPELYQTFRKISQDEFFSILEKLDLMYPWF